jgi:hypothetical protein
MALSRGRAGPIALGGGAFVALGIVVAVVLSRPASAPSTPSPVSSALGGGSVALGTPTAPGQTVVPSGATTTPTTDPANAPMAGAPELVFFQRDGDDLNLLGWRAGEPRLAVRQVVAGALRGLTDPQRWVAQLSPDSSILLVQATPAVHDGPVIVRAYRLGGPTPTLIWEPTSFGSDLVVSFVGPTQVVVASGALVAMFPSWTFADLGGASVVTREIDLPPLPRPSPGSSLDFTRLVINWAPIGLSADGRYLYLLSVNGAEPLFRPAYRIDVDRNSAEPMTSFPTTGPSRVVSSQVDEISGRLVLAGPRMTRGAGLVQAWLPGAAKPAFEVELHTVFGAQWVGDGSLLTADYDRLPGPFTFEVIRVSAAGVVDEPLYSGTGTAGALMGVEHGFAAAYLSSRDSGNRTLVVVRLVDGATSTASVTEPAELGAATALRP